ncbi:MULTISPECIES: WecB/TagA/CpsF family glycosyltransferase [unclassified Brevundimonas]|uniref:WecB/TagA/CpsF family glycosyltransferase n=1 Tax=unclassified Brevundimonas TaxID=2622653 RepID=UPI002002CDE6|nr:MULTISPECIES: WecB/TagA/CpsF family glycosyltransferase [unclassified Brevundimonas]MCK6103079.1 WecB/TagA/CpsF family glycosyltransferase [Brevundimonas sp. EYE_349]
MNSLSPNSRLQPQPEVRFAGLRFHRMTTDQTVAALAARPADLPFDLLITPNAEHAWLRRKDQAFDRISARAWLSTNDSRVLRKAAAIGGVDLGFAPGSHVVERLFKTVIGPADPITIIGGDASVIADLVRQFGLTRVAHHNPPMGFIRDAEAVQTAVEFVVAHPARFIFIAMGPPQSEKLCLRIMEDGRSTGLGLCIGSSITTLIGRTPPAPRWMEDRGLVWLYRLAREPGRLWRRYLVRGLYGLGLGLIDSLAYRLRLKSPSPRG